MSVMQTVVIQPRYKSGFGFFEDDLSTGYLFGAGRDSFNVIQVNRNELRGLSDALIVIDNLISKTGLRGHIIQVSERIKLVWTDHVLAVEDVQRDISIHFGWFMDINPGDRQSACSMVAQKLGSLLILLNEANTGKRSLANLIELFKEGQHSEEFNEQISVFDNNWENRNPSEINAGYFVVPNGKTNPGVITIAFGNADGLYQRNFMTVHDIKELRDCLSTILDIYKREGNSLIRERYTYQRTFNTRYALSGFLATIFPLREDGWWNCLLSHPTVDHKNHYAFLAGPEGIQHHIDVLDNAIAYFSAVQMNNL